jgi:hypothetical protein
MSVLWPFDKSKCPKYLWTFEGMLCIWYLLELCDRAWIHTRFPSDSIWLLELRLPRPETHELTDLASSACIPCRLSLFYVELHALIDFDSG